MWYFELTGEKDFARSRVIEVLMEIHKNRRFNYFCFVLLVECTRTGVHCITLVHNSAKMQMLCTQQKRKKKKNVLKANIS